MRLIMCSVCLSAIYQKMLSLERKANFSFVFSFSAFDGDSVAGRFKNDSRNIRVLGKLMNGVCAINGFLLYKLLSYNRQPANQTLLQAALQLKTGTPTLLQFSTFSLTVLRASLSPKSKTGMHTTSQHRLEVSFKRTP